MRLQRWSVEPIVPGLWRFPLGHDSGNAYLLQGEDGFTLVDCGYPRSEQAIFEMMRAAGCLPQDIRRVVITHSDIHHMGSLAAIRTATRAEIAGHQLEIRLIVGRGRRRWGRGIRGALVSLVYSASVRGRLSPGGPQTVDRSLVDDESLAEGWRVVHTPGHISLFHADKELLLAGDLLGQRHGRIHGPRRWLATDYPQAIASVRRVAQLRPRTIFFSHL